MLKPNTSSPVPAMVEEWIDEAQDLKGSEELSQRAADFVSDWEQAIHQGTFDELTSYVEQQPVVDYLLQAVQEQLEVDNYDRAEFLYWDSKIESSREARFE